MSSAQIGAHGTIVKEALVVGTSGFMGGEFLRSLDAPGWRVRGGTSAGVRGSTASGAARQVSTMAYEIEAVETFVRNAPPDLVLYAAGTASVPESFDSPDADYLRSVQSLRAFLEGIRRSGHRPMVLFLSSAAVYGQPEALPVSEETPLAPVSPYGHHKWMSEILLREYSVCFEIPAVSLRLFSVFGQRQRRLLLWDMHRKFNGEDPVVRLQGTGEERRDYLHVEDLVAMISSILPWASGLEGFLALNVASGVPLSVAEVAQKMGACLGSRKSVEFVGAAERGKPPRWEADLSKFKSIRGAVVRSDFDRRLRETLSAWATDVG